MRFHVTKTVRAGSVELRLRRGDIDVAIELGSPIRGGPKLYEANPQAGCGPAALFGIAGAAWFFIVPNFLPPETYPDTLALLMFGGPAVAFALGAVIYFGISSKDKAQAKASAEACQAYREKVQEARERLMSFAKDPDNRALADEVRGWRSECDVDYVDIRRSIWAAHQTVAVRLTNERVQPEEFVKRLRVLGMILQPSEEDRPDLWTTAFKQSAWLAVSDSELTLEEETYLRNLSGALRAQGEVKDIAEEERAIQEFAKLRGLSKENLPDLQVDSLMKRGERCHHRTSGAILEERVVRTYQQNNERIAERGLVETRDGDIFITDRRILMVGDGTQELRLGKILEAELDLDRNTLELSMDGRKSAIFLRVADPIYTGHLIAMVAA